MKTSDLDFESIKPIDLNSEAVKQGSKATPFSTLIWAVASGDLATARERYAALAKQWEHADADLPALEETRAGLALTAGR